MLLATLLAAGLPFYAETSAIDWNEAQALGQVFVDRAVLRPEPGAPAVVESERQNRANRPFRDLLVSWNVDAPAATGFAVELSVRQEGQGRWSPWMHVGQWGEVPVGERVVACDGGQVDVDFFRGSATFDGAQVRVRAHATAGGKTVRVRNLTLCYSDRQRTVKPRAALAERPLGKVLDVPRRSQKVERAEIAGRICSPTSVAMVLSFRGVDVGTAAVCERAYDRAHEIYGNWPHNVQAAYTFGVPGHLARYADWADVERAILDGQPLVISIAAKPGELGGAPYPKTDGHLLVLCGFDAQGDCVVNDPAASDPDEVRRVYKRADLEQVWMGRGGVAYVLLPRP